MVKWSTDSTSSPTILVRNPLKPTVKFVFDKNKKHQKDAGVTPLCNVGTEEIRNIEQREKINRQQTAFKKFTGGG